MKQLSKQIFTLIVSGLLLQNAMAGDLNLNVGLSTSMGRLHVIDSAGDSAAENVSLFMAHAEMKVNRLSKVRMNFKLLDHEFNPSLSDQGINLDGNQIQVSWLRQYRWFRTFQPWLGVGLSSNQVEVSGRYKLDSSGDVDTSSLQSDRNETDFGVVFSMHQEFELSREWLVDTAVSYELPFGDSIQGLSLSAGVKYTF